MVLTCILGENGAHSAKKEDGLEKLRKQYHCDKCGQDLHLTTTEILKHKRNCKVHETS